MNLASFFRPRWKHADPSIRVAAVNTLSDQEVLGTIARDDSDALVRHAAFARINDPEQLAEFAKRDGEFNLEAATRLADPVRLVDIARRAMSAQVRAAAVARINDPRALQEIMTREADPHVRQCARRQTAVPDPMRDHLVEVLGALEVGEVSGEGNDHVTGNLADITRSLVSDTRFRIDGVAGDPRSGKAARGQTDLAEHARHASVELIGSPRQGNNTASRAQSVSFFITVWRAGPDYFRYVVKERRLDVVQDVVKWSTSSNGL